MCLGRVDRHCLIMCCGKAKGAFEYHVRATKHDHGGPRCNMGGEWGRPWRNIGGGQGRPRRNMSKGQGWPKVIIGHGWRQYEVIIGHGWGLGMAMGRVSICTNPPLLLELTSFNKWLFKKNQNSPHQSPIGLGPKSQRQKSLKSLNIHVKNP